MTTSRKYTSRLLGRKSGSGVRELPRYRILINGRGFLIEDDDGLSKYGFFQVHWIEAASKDAAEKIALERVRANSSLRSSCRNAADDPPTLCIDEILEVPTEEGQEEMASGLAFFLEADVQAARRALRVLKSI